MTIIDAVKFNRVRNALRSHAMYCTTKNIDENGTIVTKYVAEGCYECSREWSYGEPENHAPGCACNE